jgi:hypothetical protein
MKGIREHKTDMSVIRRDFSGSERSSRFFKNNRPYETVFFFIFRDKQYFRIVLTSELLKQRFIVSAFFPQA